MKLRKLQIAWSVTGAIACVMLIGLWVWSYRWNDFVIRGHSPTRDFGGSELTTSIGTYEGTVYLWHGNRENLSINGGEELKWESGDGKGVGWHLGAYALELTNSTKSEWEASHSDTSHLSTQFQWNTSSRGDTFVCVPQWIPLLFAALAAAIPWLRWRFSLRTLLIATTLIAVALGLIVWPS